MEYSPTALKPLSSVKFLSLNLAFARVTPWMWLQSLSWMKYIMLGNQKGSSSCAHWPIKGSLHSWILITLLSKLSSFGINGPAHLQLTLFLANCYQLTKIGNCFLSTKKRYMQSPTGLNTGSTSARIICYDVPNISVNKLSCIQMTVCSCALWTLLQMLCF